VGARRVDEAGEGPRPMSALRVHVLGGSGSGTTTLGRAVAARAGAAFFDSDDFYWLATDPPFREKRDVPARRAMLGAALDGARSWVLSGSLCGWGDVFVPRFELVVLVSVPEVVRMERLVRRERERYGAARIGEGGDMRAQHEEFLAWARRYDDGGTDVRSRTMHEEWLGLLPSTCRVLRLDGTRPADELVDAVLSADSETA
jgi:adenylate kinase family enzyme